MLFQKLINSRNLPQLGLRELEDFGSMEINELRKPPQLPQLPQPFHESFLRPSFFNQETRVNSVLDRFINPQPLAGVAGVAGVAGKEDPPCTGRNGQGTTLSEEEQAWAIRYLDAIEETDQTTRREYLERLATNPLFVEQMQQQCIELGIARWETTK